jgi:photosystem II stability/assembly factor-like uncharacterized protein
MRKEMSSGCWRTLRCLGVGLLLLTASSVPATEKPARPAEAKPPFYSIRQLKRWVEQEKAHAKKRLKSLEQKGVRLTAAKRHKLKEATEYLEALLFYLELRAYPYDSVDWMAYLRAAAHRDAMASEFYPASGGPRWEFVGPRNLGVPYRTYFGIPPVTGRVNALAYHPTQEGVYYMGAPQGGLWRSTDYGATWQPLSDSWQFLQVACIAIHPTNPDILYVGTGDFQGWMRPFSIGIMKSTDGGQSWQSIGAQLFGYKCVSDILIDPENPNIVVACTGWGPYQRIPGDIWRSTDGGATWSRVNPLSAIWSDMAMGSRDPATGRRYYYAVGHGNPGYVLRSSDRGATWTVLTPPFNGEQNALRIAASPTNPNRVYLMSGNASQVWRSDNAGATWTALDPTVDGGFYQSWYDAHLHVSREPSDNDVLYLGLVDLVQRTGSGTWRSIGHGFTDNALIHVDQHAFAINPRNPNEALVGNDGGVYRMTYNPSTGAVAFTSLNATLGITQFYAADFHPTDPTRMLGGSQDNATPNANGNLNRWRAVGGGDGGYCAYNPTNPNIQYATWQYLGVVRTTNNWSSANNISPDRGSDRVAFIAPIAIHPAQPNHLLAGTNYLWRWDESTRTWTARLGNQQLSASGVVISIAGAPSNANVIYTGSNRGELWMTTNGGSSWRQLTPGSPALPNRAITAIAVHPSNPYKIYVTLGGTGVDHVWRCENTLANPAQWVNISGSGSTALPDIHANTLALDPSAPDRVIYVGTDIGMFYTLDGGATWRNGTAPLGLPNVQINTLKVVPGTGYLMAATYGRGMWRIRLPLTPAGDVNSNGCVDDSDLLAVLFAFGQSGSGLPEDVNRDGIVDDADLLTVLFNFGSGC